MICDYQCSECDTWLPMLVDGVIPHHTEGYHVDEDVWTGGNFPKRCHGADLPHKAKREKERKTYERREFRK